MRTDSRIHPRDLGMVTISGKRYVINLRPGVPFNACIEEHGGALRCWASHNYLDRRATSIVEGFSTTSLDGAHVWDREVKRGRFACTKGDHEIYRVIFP